MAKLLFVFVLIALPAIAVGVAVPSSVGANSVVAVAAGENHTCVVTVGGGVKCWGQNSYGQLGDGSMQDRQTPVEVFGLTGGVVAVSTGFSDTCAITAAGGVKCWGENTAGQLGDGTQTNRATPVDVLGLTSGVSAISVGGFHTCAVTAVGGIKCWGYGAGGALGNGTTFSYSTPVDVSGLTSGAAAVSAGGHTCAITTVGGVKCWGPNSNGQLGDGTNAIHGLPVDVLGLTSGVSAISVGGFQTCAVTTAGGAKCWGYNNHGQLGNGTTVDSSKAVDVVGLTSGVANIQTRAAHTCARTVAGGAKCWGLNAQGQLGNGTTSNSNTAVDVSGLSSNVAAISVGGQHTCAVTTGGNVRCWGYNLFGELGNGTTTSSYAPVDVPASKQTPPPVGGISIDPGAAVAPEALVAHLHAVLPFAATTVLGVGAATAIWLARRRLRRPP